VVACHNGMTCSQVAIRGHGLHMWRVAASALNKQSQQLGLCGGQQFLEWAGQGEESTFRVW